MLQAADSIDGPWDDVTVIDDFSIDSPGDVHSVYFSADRPRNDRLRLRRYYRWSWRVPDASPPDPPPESEVCFCITAVLHG